MIVPHETQSDPSRPPLDHGEEMERPDVLAAVGGRLRSLRKNSSLSQREVAEAIGLPQSNLSRIENGKQRLSLTVLSRMLSTYHTTIQEFFARDQAGGLAAESLSLREQQLVEAYRRLCPEDRREVEHFLDYRLFRARRDRSRPDSGAI